MKILALLLALLTSSCAAQSHSTRGWMVDSTTTVNAALADSAWELDLGCTGLTPQFGGQLHDVTWIVVKNGSLYVDHFAPAVGLWLAPDTIIVDSAFANVKWVLAHELMHHLLRGPPSDQGGPHPWFPFAFPCELMAGQHGLFEVKPAPTGP